LEVAASILTYGIRGDLLVTGPGIWHAAILTHRANVYDACGDDQVIWNGCDAFGCVASSYGRRPSALKSYLVTAWTAYHRLCECRDWIPSPFLGVHDAFFLRVDL
jgi:hypothetical protein